jgi:TonB family protein
LNITKHHIIKYLKGDLPYSEQYELEKMMLEDPFLSDAIEGLQEINDSQKLSETLLEIEGLIESNYGKRRVLVPIYKNPLAIAAVISLLIVSVAVVLLVPDYRQKVQSFLITKKDKDASEPPESGKQEELFSEKEEPEEEIALSDSAFEIVEEQPTLTNLDLESSEEELTATIESEEPSTLAIADSVFFEDQTALIAEEEDPFINQPVIDTTSAILATNDVAGEADQIEKLTVAEDEGISEDLDIRAKRAAPQSRAQLLETPIKSEVSGVVTSASDNQPIAGVNVIIGGTSRGTITDASGRYSLEVTEDVNTIQFSFIDFQPYVLNVANSGSYNVGLSTDSQQLSEVIVIGFGGADNRTQGSDKFAEPESNRTAYNRYLRENLVYPDSAGNNNISGRVVVEFSVGVNGSISNLEISRSLGYGCDEEALRLIREGPPWRPAIRNGSLAEERVRVAVRFNP